MFWISVLEFGGWTPSSDVMCSIIQSLDNGLDNGLDNPDQVWIMEWISVRLSKGNTDVILPYRYAILPYGSI